MNGREIIEKLKRVYVLTRIMQTDVEDFKKSIAINNNTQNALSYRDLVSKNIEQKKLGERLLSREPKIYVQIVSGSSLKPYQTFYSHRKNSTNEFLAQLAYAAFLLQPGSAKDKKASLFKFDDDGIDMNKEYKKIFNYDNTDRTKCGILIQKTENDNKAIDEVLFVAQLYKDSKKYLKDYLVDLKLTYQAMMDNSTEESKRNKELSIASITNRLDINNICMFYTISFFYAHREIDGIGTSGNFDFENYYCKNSNRIKFEKILNFAKLLHIIMIDRKLSSGEFLPISGRF